VDVQLHAFFTSALDVGEWSASRTGRFTPRERALRTKKCIWKQYQEAFTKLSTKTAVLGTSHIIRKVLQSETWSLSGGVYHWFKRSTREKETYDDDDDDDDDNFSTGFYSPCLRTLVFLNGLLDPQTFGKTPWLGDQSNTRPLPTQGNTTQKHADTHPCPEQNSNLRSQYSSGRRQYMP
jgi:hypothetical protein